MYRLCSQILNSNEGDFPILVKICVFEENLGLIFWSLCHDVGGFTCMSHYANMPM